MTNKKIQNDPNIFTKVKCGVCKIRPAVNVCDFVIEYHTPSFFRNYEDFKEQELHQLCNYPMCESCSYNHNRIYHFCPHHKALLEKIKPTREMNGPRSEWLSKDFFKQGE